MNLKKSLQAIKTDIVNKEETLKTIRQNHPHLATLSETQILAYFGVDTMDTLKYIKESAQLRHDKFIVQEKNICSCTDSHGQAKNLYNSEASAQEEANVRSKDKKLQLDVYRCPYGCGWHLTKR